MLHPSVIQAKLAKVGFKHSRWFEAEVRELEHLLMDDEDIVALACGRYFGSFALLVASDKRLLLIDKRVFFMTIQDARYDMISEIDYNSQVVGATVTIHTMNKSHKFSSIKNRRELRDLTSYVQRRVWESRQQIDSRPAAQVMPPAPQAVQAVPQQPVIASASTDYYVEAAAPVHRVITEKMATAAHKIGPAATYAAHTPQRVNPYAQGSLITHSPIVNQLDY